MKKETSRNQNRIKHSEELRRYNQQRGLLNRLDCELELTDDAERLQRLRWLIARVLNNGQVFLGVDDGTTSN
jgi:hypothetical protein